MRYVLALGFCVFAAACSGEGSRAPTSPSSSGTTGAATDAKAASALPFKGTLEGTELVEGTAHHIDATGNATELGLFTLVVDLTVDAGVGSGTAIWTAANGDQLFTSTTGTGIITFPIVTINETSTITGGTARFAGASGAFTIERSVNLLTHVTTASFSGTINLDR
jgi:hypothetical protein